MGNTKETKLIFYIKEGLLEGIINGEYISMKAKSGGGGQADNETKFSDPKIINNYCKIDKVWGHNNIKAKITSENRGGPIVPGYYNIQKRTGEDWSRKVKLSEHGDTLKLSKKLGRTGNFEIHSPGPYGSDGCIVPNSEDFIKLMDKLNKTSGNGTLIVKKSKGAALPCNNNIIDSIKE